MKKACKYCGGIHDSGYTCPKKPLFIRKKYTPKKYPRKRNSVADKFRSSYDWQQKRTYILKRDKYLCRACFCGLHGTVRRLTSDGLSVHHIVPIKEDFSLRLDDDNLITLCAIHHELAESGKISAEELTETIPPTS